VYWPRDLFMGARSFSILEVWSKSLIFVFCFLDTFFVFLTDLVVLS